MRLPKVYEPDKYETEIYALWEREGAFLPKNRGKDSYFSITLPPPNANGDLHMGHALINAIQDSLVRYHRMQGSTTLYIPGADHAGFETQVVYERKLEGEGKSRFDFSREELYRQIWDFVQANKHNFEAQLRALGASLDWSRYTFTLDNKVVATSYATFQKMWHDGLIYRGARIVNYCTFHGTSFSDIEVVHEEEKTKLWHIAYPLTDGSGEVVIATTRPETKLGQSALMVNPKDGRYKNLVGKEVTQPLVPGKPIEIISDDYVDMEFGTGVVTVTPGHDTNDFEVGQRHHLPVIELITTEGKMSEQVPGPFRGLTIKEARGAVEKTLKEKGYLRGVEDYTHSVGKCYKCGTIIEPLVREQWFVRMRPLADEAIKHLENKEVSFYPASKHAQTIKYLQEVRDWNISRQIAWGMPIPAFQNTSRPDDWVFDTRVDQEQIEVNGQIYKRDPDVFDTWFSSGQWPFVTLDYPDSADFKQFYPLSLMETGGEILYQWVARMIMLGLYTTGKVPFKDVYIHGYVLAEDGQKMSKSIGNVINPLEIINRYGSDALRMGLLTGRRAGVNQGYHPAKMQASRNFSNKLWNVARFIEDKVGDAHSLKAGAAPRSVADHWILQKLSGLSEDIAKYLEHYRLSEAFEVLYIFVWHDLADWYIEVSKSENNPAMMAYVLESTLKLTHPFAPFVTETIWQTLAWEEGTLLAVQHWPIVPQYDAALAGQFQQLKEVVEEVRQITSILGVKKPSLYFRNAPVLAEHYELVTRLARLGSVQAAETDMALGLRLTASRLDCWLDIDRQTAQNYIDKLKARQTEQEGTVRRLESRLANRDYTAKAPPELVAQTRQQLAEDKAQLDSLEEELDRFQAAAGTTSEN